MEAITTTTVVGCDVGDKYSHVCVLDGSGAVVDRARLRSSRAGFEKWFAGRSPSVVAIEVGTHSRWLSTLLRAMGHEVLVANARQVRLIYAGRKKNDRLDAEALARLAKFDRRLLGPIQHRGANTQAQLAVLRARDQLVKARTELVNHVRGVTKSAGLRIPKCESSSLPRRAREVITEALRPALEPLLDSIEQLSAKIKAFDEQIEAMAEKDPNAKRIAEINGVGALTVMAFLLTLEDPTRFARSRDVGPFLGMVPRQSQSGDNDPQLRITRAGDSFVRRLLIQCAHHILGPHGRESDLRRFGQRLAARGGKNAKKKAVVAVARKLAVLMHHLWVTGEIYEPLRQQDPTMQAA